MGRNWKIELLIVLNNCTVNFLTSLNGCVRAITCDLLRKTVAHRLSRNRHTQDSRLNRQMTSQTLTQIWRWWDNHESESRREKIINKSDFGHNNKTTIEYVNGNNTHGEKRRRRRYSEARLANPTIIWDNSFTPRLLFLLRFWWIYICCCFSFEEIIIFCSGDNKRPRR